jgi:ATP phosphoribosyltransferase regulatory subunit
MKTNKLLPTGFCDLLFEEAEKNHRDINSILDLFLEKKFRLIKTPLVEFEDSVLGDGNNFKTIDVTSNKMLVFRNDITLQIARLLDSRLKDRELPLKLCYVGDVLRAKNNGFTNDRQRTQVGIEIIGCNLEKSYFEVIQTTLTALEKVVNKNILIEVSLPDFLEIFLTELDLELNLKEKLADAILSKNISQIREILPKKSKSLEQALLRNSDLGKISQEFLQDFSSPEIVRELKKAQNISNFLPNNRNIELCFDIFGDHKSLYHNSIAFDIFAENLATPVARGGIYKINNIDAVGATIYMNQVAKFNKI